MVLAANIGGVSTVLRQDLVSSYVTSLRDGMSRARFGARRAVSPVMS